MSYAVFPILMGFCLDLLLGDPHGFPHPVVWMGKLIHWLEQGVRRVFPKTPTGEKIAGAVLDVVAQEPLPEDHSLWSCPNTIITPHVSGDDSLPLNNQLVVDIFLNNFQNYIAKKPLNHMVDLSRQY